VTDEYHVRGAGPILMITLGVLLAIDQAGHGELRLRENLAVLLIVFDCSSWRSARGGRRDRGRGRDGTNRA